MDITTKTDWQAQWIWNEGEASPRNEWWCFRKTFEVPIRGWDHAQLALTADSRYVLYVNGKQVGRGPVRSWPTEQFYDTYDIGYLLKPGQENTLAVLVLHFGVSNFYYLRGRGGLLAQLELMLGDKAVEIVATDASWKTTAHLGQDPRSGRMSCQQAFAERIDARAFDLSWMNMTFDDHTWSNASEIGSVGMEPWTQLIPRDIPFLTEEVFYPVRIESLSRIKPVAWSAAVNLRNQMVPDSVNHANMVGYVGYVATVIRVQEKAKVSLGFPWGIANFGVCTINGVVLDSVRFTGTLPERYIDVELQPGDNLFMMDVTGEEHDHGFHLSVHGDTPFEVVSPLGANSGASPFVTIGPFDTNMIVDHQENRKLSIDHEVYRQVIEAGTSSELAHFQEWIKPVPNFLVSRDDILSLCIWKAEEQSQKIPAALQNAVIATSIPAVIPYYEGAETEFIIDFDRELSGFITFEVEAAEGTILDFYGYEYMRDGWRQDTFGLDNTLRYTCQAGRQTYTSPVRRGLRYLMVTVRNAKSPVKLYHIQMIQSNYPVAEIGRFQSSDPLLNDIWQISKHTTRLCMEDTFVDCPSYEQVFWVGDSRNEAIVNYYVFGAEEIVKRCLRLVPGSKFQTPLYADQVPSGWSSVIPNWTFFWAIACKEYYDQTGEEAFAREMWPHIKYSLDHYLDKIDERGLLFIKGWNLLDWAPIDQPNDGVVTHQNVFLVKTLRVAAKLAEIAGDPNGGTFAAAADKLQEAINKHLWSVEKQAYLDCIHADGRLSTNYSMQTQVVAFLCDVAEGKRKLQMEQYMMEPPADFVQIGSPFMSFFYYEALAQVGYYDRMIADIRRNFGQMIEYDATTCWEMYPNFAENRANPNMLTRSHCHAWSAAPAYFLGAYVLGVRNGAPGWSEVIVAPQPCGLIWARGTVPLPESGRIDVAWRVEELGKEGGAMVDTTASKKMSLQVWAPRGLKVTIKLPDGYEGRIQRFEV
ncbi:MAG TPA: family 78 glycoside hydrolase catalytic domain [Bacilli bacterium]